MQFIAENCETFSTPTLSKLSTIGTIFIVSGSTTMHRNISQIANIEAKCNLQIAYL